ncbi:M1 family metallopeptidase [Haloflavibacter putidus]|uniref:M1 family metallopeptidase n=1 Tax=Haloflavibacter putidus TaxID=2576776 RepID=A0A507ZVS3_9FLAO|nr:M1 family metallopeptidase [Haloflavibacter putidus]TQD40701.1 M1 family metallopeptidase [Haloflavibacter putidus]
MCKHLKQTCQVGLLFFICSVTFAQNNTSYWQQHVDYTMEVDMNVKNYQYTGKQELVYTNNSPDTLQQVFYHLYFNAFQPGSEMDVRSRTIQDPDSRVGSRIAGLKPNEVGYLKIDKLEQDGKQVNHKTVGTILQVSLDKPILPGEKTTFKMDFNGQVPKQIRRSGRNSAEGVALSMTQWYPKLAEYDFEGWHATPYIGREFHGVWGDFDVKITIDKDYVLGGTGYLQNPNKIGHGYQDKGTRVKHRGKKLTWHFKAPKVHDFTWAADPDFVHDIHKAKDGTTLHFLYKDNPSYEKENNFTENWKKLQPKTEALLDFFTEHIGPYPYKQYSVIQGGDGGMEYAMSTLITGNRKFGSLVGVTAHELAHTWFQFVLATNETKHEWMDEGFTTYISSLAMNEVMNEEKENPLAGSYRGYTYLANSGNEQPQSTHADRYNLNQAYGLAAYSKGAVFLGQLGYIIGQENLSKTLHRYYDEWKFKHPTPNDFIRVAEKVSGANLSWYLTDWTQTTNTIDYTIEKVTEKEGKTQVQLKRKGLMPMPLDVKVSYKDGSSKNYYIPLRMLYFTKPGAENIQKDWPWAMPTYTLSLDTSKESISKIEIDPSQLMADVERENNVYEN